ncbi:MAG TPA: hypothetical protein VFQ23_16130, partial [Anaerolineales bacterium]|nr:hypothetical protein [Anaerolineales bacterium]
TVDLTLAAEFIVQPTQTRIPTFTPPPPLEVPQFNEAGNSSQPSGTALGILILLLVIIGGVGLALSFVLRTQ